jgi:hypothetical protein
MDYVRVDSSNVSELGYDAANVTLGVRFHSGSEYHYFGVPVEVFEALRNASSIGSYFDRVVRKGGYRYTRVK